MKMTDHLRIAINSTAYYLLSYLFVFIFHQVATIIAAGFFEFHVEVDYSRIIFMISRYEWDFDSVKIIFSAGPVAVLILSIVMIVFAYRYNEYVGSLKLFFLWGFVHCISIVLGSAYAGALLGEGFGHVLLWMYMADTAKLIISLISLFLLAATGYSVARMFLLSANIYYKLLSVENRLSFVIAQVILPFILGSFCILALRLPLNLYEIIRILTPLIVVLMVLLSSFGYSVFYFDENPRTIKINGSLVAIALIVYSLYRIALLSPIYI
ncbi:MAG: hypothetical protein K0B15_07165 [Lentimicrobium sp.]|nr:hypothetical protein [Lentimicrobium sp.]